MDRTFSLFFGKPNKNLNNVQSSSSSNTVCPATDLYRLTDKGMPEEPSAGNEVALIPARVNLFYGSFPSA